jgi:hypothetical protein
MQPGGGPNRNNFLLFLLAMGGFTAFAFWGGQPTSTEINYMDFITQYLQQNKVTMITLTEEKGNSNFKYRAIIDTNGGQKFHLTLP